MPGKGILDASMPMAAAAAAGRDFIYDGSERRSGAAAMRLR